MNSAPPQLARRLMSAFAAAFVATSLVAQTTAPSTTAPAATTAPDEAVTLSVFEVTAKKDVGYRSVFSTSGSLVAEELANLPSSISVMNQEFLKDIGSTDIFEASRYATGGEFGQVNDTNFFFRGIQNNWQARNFFIWYLPTDQFSIERLEVVRGPNALLYGDAQPGGLLNIISKRANTNRDANTVRLMIGSWERYRAEGDFNKVIIPNKLAARLNVVSQRSKDWRDFRHNDIDAVHAAVSYTPTRNTRVRAEFEAGDIKRNLGHGIFSDNFSGASQAVPAAQQWTVLNGTLQQIGGTWSTGSTALLLTDNPVPREYQFTGPDRYQDRSYTQAGLNIDHTFFEKLTFEAAISRQDQQNRDRGFNNTTAVRRDLNATLPGGAANPNFNQLFVHRTLNELNVSNRVTDVRLSAVYELDIPKITKQRLIAFWTQREDQFDAQNFQERRVANLSNQVFRRHYVNSYSAQDLSFDYVPNATRMFGAGFWADNIQTLTATSTAAVGSYLDGRLRSLVGYRRDKWEVQRGNIPNGGVVTTAVPNPSGGTVNEQTGFSGRRVNDADIYDDSLNYGGVAHVLRDFHGLNFSIFGNYSESFRPVSGAVNLTGGGISPIKGEGTEYGVRVEALEGRVAFNFINYTIDQTNSPINIAQNIRDEINNMFGAGTVVPAGANTVGDTATLRSEGWELEATLNLTRNWTFTANYSVNDKKQTSILPVTLPFWEQARAANRPLTDYLNLNNLVVGSVSNADLVAPEIKTSWNFFTRYRFTEGALKGFSAGLGANYRDSGYLGVISGAPYYSESSMIWNAVLGYAGKVRGHNFRVDLNVNNVTDEDYYVAFALNSAGWSNPRELRLSTTWEF